jgi:hypothetical protein
MAVLARHDGRPQVEPDIPARPRNWRRCRALPDYGLPDNMGMFIGSINREMRAVLETTGRWASNRER